MGYSYGWTKEGGYARDCDNCGNTGGTKLRQCPQIVYTSTDRSERRHGLHYCPAPSLCNRCYAELKPTLHANCVEGAAQSQREHDAEQERLDRGDHRITSRCGDWHKDVPKGLIGCTYTASGYRDHRYVLLPHVHQGVEWLEDLPIEDILPWPEGGTA